MNRLATCLTILACVLVALVPFGGLSLCFGDGLCDVDVGSNAGCPCGGHEDVPVEEHFDLSVDSVDGLPAKAERELEAPQHDVPVATEVPPRCEAPRAAIATEAPSPPPPIEIGAMRAHRATVLLI